MAKIKFDKLNNRWVQDNGVILEPDGYHREAERWEAYFLGAINANGDNEMPVPNLIADAADVASAALEEFYKHFPALKPEVSE